MPENSGRESAGPGGRRTAVISQEEGGRVRSPTLVTSTAAPHPRCIEGVSAGPGGLAEEGHRSMDRSTSSLTAHHGGPASEEQRLASSRSEAAGKNEV